MRCFSQRKFGVELEIGNETSQEIIKSIITQTSKKFNFPCKASITGWEQSINNDFWHIKRDATCGLLGKPYDFGWEIASPVSSGSLDLNFIGQVSSSLNKFGLKANKNCGYHVHVDVSDFEPYHMGILLIRWLKIEKYLLNLVPNHRRNNIHCKTYYKSKKFNLLKSENLHALHVWHIFKPDNFKPYENPQKRYALNLTNYAKSLWHEELELSMKQCRKTLELRLPEGTLNSEDVINWVRFFVNFIDTSRRTRKALNLDFVNTEKQFLKICGLDGNLSDELLETKNWVIKRKKCFQIKNF